jgi:uncharacterized FlaG/YvyC family protein
MATISRIESVLSSRLIGQVAETTRPLPDNPPQRRVREIQAPRSPRGVNDTSVSQNTVPQQIASKIPEQVREAIEYLKKTMAKYSVDPHEVGFRRDPSTDDVVIEIRNPEGELLKQFPPEKVLNLHRKLDELSGMVIDRMT